MYPCFSTVIVNCLKPVYSPFLLESKWDCRGIIFAWRDIPTIFPIEPVIRQSFSISLSSATHVRVFQMHLIESFYKTYGKNQTHFSNCY